MRSPHTVRLDGPDGSQMITRKLSDLEFTNIENGGYGSGSFVLKRAIDRKQLDPFTRVRIFDSRNGNQVCGGRLLTPGRTSSNQGQISRISFLGEGPAAFSAVERPDVLIDTDVNAFTLGERTTRRMQVSTSTYPNSTFEDPSLLLETTEDKNLTSNAELIMVYRQLAEVGRQLGGFGFRHKSGASGGGVYYVRGRAYATDLATWNSPIDDSWSPSLSARRIMTVNGDFTPGRTIPSISWRSTVTTVAVEDTWSAGREPIVRARLFGRDGALRTTGYTNEYVLIGEAFIDYCVRNCPTLDIANAVIAAGTYQFDQLAWMDGIDGQGFMDELLGMEQALMWGVFEQQANGLHRTELIARPTTVRYEVDINGGYDDNSPSDELCNVVYVTWTSPAGRPQVTRVPSSGVASVPALDASGDIQAKTLALGSEVGSEAQAVRRGQQYLTAHSYIPNGGSLTIGGSTRVLDNYTGRRVAPWEILGGYLCRIKGLYPRPDLLNSPTGPNGSTIAKIVSMNWSDSRGSAQLTLDSYPLDQWRLIAALRKRRR